MAMISDAENAKQNVNALTAMDIDWCCLILYSRRIQQIPMITWQWYEPLKHTYNSIFYIPFYLEAVNTELELCQTLDPLCTFKIDVIGSKDCLFFEVTGYFVPEEALCTLLRAL